MYFLAHARSPCDPDALDGFLAALLSPIPSDFRTPFIPPLRFQAPEFSGFAEGALA
jgi:hypothetical protein